MWAWLDWIFGFGSTPPYFERPEATGAAGVRADDDEDDPSVVASDDAPAEDDT